MATIHIFDDYSLLPYEKLQFGSNICRSSGKMQRRFRIYSILLSSILLSSRMTFWECSAKTAKQF